MLPIPFDNPATYPGHSGVDFGQPQGTPILASGPFVIHSRMYNARAGYGVWVRYDGPTPDVLYCHMPSHAAVPAPGTRGGEGSPIGVVGNTGNSTGPHLHVEVEGYATTAGFWQWFTPDRVVGRGPASSPSASSLVLEDEMIRIQSPNRGIALIGPGYYRHLTSGAEVEASHKVISKHETTDDATFDLWVSLAIGGDGPATTARKIATEGRPLKLYDTDDGLTLFGPGGKTWPLPSDAYRPLLDALGLAPLHPIRYLPENEISFVKMILSLLAPDPAAIARVEKVLEMPEAEVAAAVQALGADQAR